MSLVTVVLESGCTTQYRQTAISGKGILKHAPPCNDVFVFVVLLMHLKYLTALRHRAKTRREADEAGSQSLNPTWAEKQHSPGVSRLNPPRVTRDRTAVVRASEDGRENITVAATKKASVLCAVLDSFGSMVVHIFTHFRECLRTCVVLKHRIFSKPSLETTEKRFHEYQP